MSVDFSKTTANDNTNFSPIEHKQLTDKVYESLKKAIYTQELKPGEKLDIFQIAEAYGVSRSPVKEAFNRLSMEGLLDIVPRKGTFVSTFEVDKVIELLDARLMFEVWAGKKLIRNLDTKQLHVMKEILIEMDQVLLEDNFDYFKYNNLDIEFHRSLIVALGNNQIIKMYDSLNALWFAGRGTYGYVLEKLKLYHPEHHRLIEALANQDDVEFEIILNQHIESAKKDFLNFYGNR